MKISEIIKDKYKLRIPSTVYYDLLADAQEAEEEQEPCEDFKQKAGVVISQLRADRDRLEKEFKEIERKIRAWQRDIHDNEDDAEEFDFVFDGIYEILAEHRKGEE